MQTEFRMFWREEDGMWSHGYKVVRMEAGSRPSTNSIRFMVKTIMLEQFGSEIKLSGFSTLDIDSVQKGKEVRFVCHDTENVQLFVSVKVMEFHLPLPTVVEELEDLLKPVGDVIVIPLTQEEFNKITGADKPKEEKPALPERIADAVAKISAFGPENELLTKGYIDAEIELLSVNPAIRLAAKYRVLAELGNAYKAKYAMVQFMRSIGRDNETQELTDKVIAIDELAREYSTELFGKEM